MQSRDFCYWLQGFFEISDTNDVDKHQIEVIKNHLKMVFKYEIDPSIDKGDPEVKEGLDNLHNPKNVIRC